MRFTLRDILWLTIVAGLVLGWWLDHRRFGLAPDHLQTVINILASHNIRVELGQEGAKVVTPLKAELFDHYQAFGMGVLKDHAHGGIVAVEHPPVTESSADDD
jgi:hypothetical protein